MPYFRNMRQNVNLLYIHIPKTGGSTIEKYLTKKFNKGKRISARNLYTNHIKNQFNRLFYGSPQHQSFRTLMRYSNHLGIYKKGLEILASVRNPYTRVISDLFHFRLINRNSTPNQVFDILKRYVITKHQFDNHNLPQYTFLINKKGVIPKRIKIIKNETLNKDMINLGYIGFNKIKKSRLGKEYNTNYYNYLNNNSIQLINNVYDQDFKFFKYVKIS